LPSLAISTPAIGLNLCCNLAIPAFALPILPLGAILGPLATTVEGIIATIAAVIAVVNALLDSIAFSCPLE